MVFKYNDIWMIRPKVKHIYMKTFSKPYANIIDINRLSNKTLKSYIKYVDMTWNEFIEWSKSCDYIDMYKIFHGIRLNQEYTLYVKVHTEDRALYINSFTFRIVKNSDIGLIALRLRTLIEYLYYTDEFIFELKDLNSSTIDYYIVPLYNKLISQSDWDMQLNSTLQSLEKDYECTGVVNPNEDIDTCHIYNSTEIRCIELSDLDYGFATLRPYMESMYLISIYENYDVKVWYYKRCIITSGDILSIEYIEHLSKCIFELIEEYKTKKIVIKFFSKIN